MFDLLVNFFGTIVTCIFVVYLVLLALLQGKNKELTTANTLINMADMPVLRPIPISTANQNGLLNKILILVFQVRRWRVEEAFIFEYKGKKYAVHAGFEFNGASIPKPLWGLLSPVGLLLIPGLIHDYGYRYNGIYILDENNKPEWDETISVQSGWDELFKGIGNDINQIPMLNELAKFGLWLGGFKAWRAWRDKKEDKVPFKWTVDDEKRANNKHQEQVSEGNVDDIDNANKKGCSNELFVSGTTKTTQIGYENSNKQKVLGSRNLDATDKKRVTYKMACGHCDEVYGAKTAEIHRRKCPACQEGKPSVNW
ncbi:DUF1353 domain-containing protein [Colwellia psychrerythraea]|uniref:DUF1353 domain-containing protein n=1 Tax=Colwellia psychrerythraea TaxID=28229 RepID=A0A099KGN2_COLPS|nr:DUF1353 domain-containing protein [Colwellia psychrerythraea]KGJ89506.1 protein of unknown function DUF1353 [Colwellia psychrerythraea]